jgi:AraC-like DNA-binding protein
LCVARGDVLLAKIAAKLIASGEGWSIADVVCSAGPNDRPFEEQHDQVAIAIVTGGSFQYRGSGASRGRELMTPGSLLLGYPGQLFECGHEHAHGDRCLAFRYAPRYFAEITDGVALGGRERFGSLRLPPMRELSSIVARACAARDVWSPTAAMAWEELTVRLALQAVRVDRGRARSQSAVSSAALARVTGAVRFIEQNADEALSLAELAKASGLSLFHFLRTFTDLTGTTPHQYVMRMRLRRAAAQLLAEPAKILDVALDNGFGDVSNFNRAFRTEFGVSPRACRNERRLAP